MTIKSSGSIAVSDINIELAFNSNTPKSLNDSDVRTLLAKSSGIISLSDAYGKTKAAAVATPGNTFIAGRSTSQNLIGFERLSSSFNMPAADIATWTPGSINPSYIPISVGKIYELFSDPGGWLYMAGIFPGAPYYITVNVNGLDFNFEYYTTDGTQMFYANYYDLYNFNYGQSYTVR